ncbi:hypothetical protein ACO2Q0_05200 [Phenylobacterium sp. VNQ135]|uniref:hypothetical protein n=1 Tax=Phenylobacterium sp. VNQ135 TaxID=3400922 RepID=UPI003C0236FD
MPTYRAYLMSPLARILEGHWIEAESDEEAFARARGLCRADAPRVELWLRDRRVGVITRDAPQPGDNGGSPA